MGRGLGSGSTQPEKALSMGPRLDDIQACLGPAQRGRDRMSKGGPLECGVPEFGGRALGEGVWVGFRPSAFGGGLRGGLRV